MGMAMFVVTLGFSRRIVKMIVDQDEEKMSVSSMTGFAHEQIETDLGLLAVDIKSVNSRYQEISLRLPEELRFLEGEIRSVLSQSVARGKIECRMQWVGEAIHEQTLNIDAMERLLSLQKEVTEKYPETKPLTVSQILTFPGILTPKVVDLESLRSDVVIGLERVINSFLESRIREGSALAKVILSYCDEIERYALELKPRIPEIIGSIQNKLKERLTESLSHFLYEHSKFSKDEINDRIRQEVILYAIKIDVDEELNRLLTHIKEVRRLVSQGGEVGKRLDFLVQELNREANTLGSKASAIEMTQTSLTLKINIEKIREQAQNLE